MKTFKENDRLIYTDSQGTKIDIFAVFDTDKRTGMTHINHKNLEVSKDLLKPHPHPIPGAYIPVKTPSVLRFFGD